MCCEGGESRLTRCNFPLSMSETKSKPYTSHCFYSLAANLHHVTSCFSSFSQVHEEIGYDITPLLNPDDFIEVTMNDQKMTLFIVCDVPRDAKFETLTRKEISVSPLWGRRKRLGLEEERC